MVPENVWSFAWLVYQNANAAWGTLPSEAKIAILAIIAIQIVYGTLKKAWKLVKFGAVCAALYFAATYFGLI